ncbi:putative ABC transport system ATP-binding protein [Bradyrhizobium sp. GM2.2]|jgi:putative ABC transport system ATP-binding protein|uniref:ABC transporter ATP-binding protein n=1 Tax=Bradyrhizobium TaxID=374 RepID=UPI00195B3E2D|nr:MULTISPECIES: ABC transporter ATP-binding protein [Bradyrhizobium]MBM7483279.1 putative ABC transport system ATP-binding protein [Bradyrhizobium canariense]MCK1268536.1 ABC transporter ATP-binding protein [Bradyrhizobium sp. 84]MCK1293309.1 ABC transporter ATP-binding protein [Bradyrhizobium sp. 30]MCK1312004.1 ABC transporter ATP-binding protein [Bradyrhizobium sp. 23]MCK1327106.1 ABC transporter ATP-binding protein [Bradyrhizobium sp. CW9]
MTALPPLISLQSVSRTYRADGVAVTAVRNVSFDIERGEIVAVMGPSGSGKSTLMNMIGLLDLPSEGALYLEGADVADLSEDHRSSLRARSIGFVFQSYNLLARHNAIENVALPLVYCGISRKERLARAEQSLEAVGMVHRAHHFPRQLSGGEQQRVAIARALIASPLIVLADEPTGALDSRTGAEILALFAALNRSGQTIVMITHDPGIATQCRRTIRLHDGELVADETLVPILPKRNAAP